MIYGLKRSSILLNFLIPPFLCGNIRKYRLNLSMPRFSTVHTSTTHSILSVILISWWDKDNTHRYVELKFLNKFHRVRHDSPKSRCRHFETFWLVAYATWSACKCNITWATHCIIKHFSSLLSQLLVELFWHHVVINSTVYHCGMLHSCIKCSRWV